MGPEIKLVAEEQKMMESAEPSASITSNDQGFTAPLLSPLPVFDAGRDANEDDFPVWLSRAGSSTRRRPGSKAKD